MAPPMASIIPCIYKIDHACHSLLNQTRPYERPHSINSWLSHWKPQQDDMFT